MSSQLSDLGVLNEALEIIEKNDTALGTHAYCKSESHLSGYRLTIGFDTLDQVQAAHQAIVDAGKRRHSQAKFCSKQCRKRLSPPRACPYCSKVTAEQRTGKSE